MDNKIHFHATTLRHTVQYSCVRSWRRREALLPVDFLRKKNSGMYIAFIVRLNDRVFASTADRLVSDNLFLL